MNSNDSRLSRRRGVAAFTVGLLCAPVLSEFGNAAGIKWTIGHTAPASSPIHLRLLEAAESISRRSNGMLTMTVVGEGRLGIQSGLMRQVRSGALEIALLTSTQLASISPLCSIPSIGFAFPDYAHLWSAIDGDLGQLIRTELRTVLNFEVLERVWDFGFRHITTIERPVNEPSDLNGLKIRVQTDSEELDMFHALGAVPVTIAFPYLRMVLEHHQIDGQESTLPLLQYARLNEVQRFCAMTHHVWDGFWICINTDAWKRLPERLQQIVANTLNGAAQRQRADIAELNDSIRDVLIKGGMKFTDVDNAKFREKLRDGSYFARQKTKFGDDVWSAIQRTTGIPA